MADPQRPVPESALLHCIALLPEPPESLEPLRERLAARLPGATLDLASWTDRTEPRSYAFGPVLAGGYAFHLLVDREGMPQAVGQAVTAAHMSPASGVAVQQHAACALCFLVGAPDDAGPLDRLRALASVAFAFLDLGATVIAFPEGRAALHRDELVSLDPQKLGPDEAWIAVSFGYAGHADESGLQWVRTFGMPQLGLPEVICRVKSAAEEELLAAEALLSSIPSYLLSKTLELSLGDRLSVGKRRWHVAETPVPPPFPPPKTGLVWLVRDPRPEPA